MKKIIGLALLITASQALAEDSFKCWNADYEVIGGEDGAVVEAKLSGEKVTLEKSFAFKDYQLQKIVQSYGGAGNQPVLNVIMGENDWKAVAAVLWLEKKEYMICTGEVE